MPQSSSAASYSLTARGKNLLENLVVSIINYKSLSAIRSPSNAEHKDTVAALGMAMRLSNEFMTDWVVLGAGKLGHTLHELYDYGLFIGKELAKILRLGGSKRVGGVNVYDFLGLLTKQKGTRGYEVKYGLMREESGLPLLEQQKLVFWRAARTELARYL